MSSYWDNFIACQTPDAVAKHLLQDISRLDNGTLPSQLAMHIPRPSSKEALEIASFLTPSPDLHLDLKQYLYEKIRTRLRKAIGEGQGSGEPPLPEDGYLTVGDLSTTLSLDNKTSETKMLPPGEDLPTKGDIKTTVRVLRYLDIQIGERSGAINQVIDLVQTRFRTQPDPNPDASPGDGALGAEVSIRWADQVREYHGERPPTRLRVCYICRFLLVSPHPLYRSLCQPCGTFNAAGSTLSLPASLKLRGRTALVTGARVNLGYHTAMRLLRCGASVIATTRYPHDAALRYAAEADSNEWSDRLRVVGADFRTARDAFALVKAVRAALAAWGVKKLYVLVNNAAQTLTDSIRKEEVAVAREKKNEDEAVRTGFVFSAPAGVVYQARVRGGVAPLALYGGDPPKAVTQSASDESVAVLPENVKDDGRAEVAPYFKSSWVQTMDEIPYEDVVSAHAVNAFVPLILCREVLPLMGTDGGSDTEAGEQAQMKTGRTKAPCGYIINVSSREGLFENRSMHSAKRAFHVHTNMTKAALNMITQTEAAAAWRARRVAMNTVDPGYMSAASEMDHVFGGERPLDWEDGAGRVLWPVAMGEVEGSAIWGRFLKHFGAADVEVDVSP